MRIGAIFARGSCRALKWMLVLGTLSVLGSAQALAQPEIDTATYTGTGSTVTVTMTERVYLDPGNSVEEGIAGDFAVYTINGTTLGTTATRPTRVTGLGVSETPGATSFQLQFNQVVSAIKGTADGLRLAYTQQAGTDGRRIKATLGNQELDTTSGLHIPMVGPGEAFRLTLTIPAPTKTKLKIFEVGTEIATAALPIALGAATGVADDTTVTYSLVGLPETLTNTPVSGETARENGAAQIHGSVPTYVRKWTVVYRASAEGEDPVEDTFTITVADQPARPGKPTITVAGPTSLAVKWIAPDANEAKIEKYELRYKSETAADWNTITDIPGTSYTLRSLTGGTYQVQVRAYNAIDWSEWSLVADGTTGPAAGKPTLSLAVDPTIPEGRSDIPVSVTVSVPPSTEPTRTVSVTLTLAKPAKSDPETDAELPSTVNSRADVRWAGAAATSAKTTISFTFTSELSQTRDVNLVTGTDDDAENEKFRITGTAKGANANVLGSGSATPRNSMVVDAQVQRYMLTLPYALETEESMTEGYKGAGVPVRLEVSPGRTVPKGYIVSLESEQDASDYRLTDTSTGGPSSVRLRLDLAASPEGADQTRSITLTSEMNDGDRVDDTITLRLFDSTAPSATATGEQLSDDVVLMVVDQHKLPKVSIGSIKVDGEVVTSIAEGETGTVELMLDRGTNTDDVPDNEAIKVMLSRAASSSAAADDFDLDSAEVSIAGGRTMGTFKLEAVVNDDIGDEMLVLQAEVKGAAVNGADGESTDLAAITITDATDKLVWAKTEDEIYAAVIAAIGEDKSLNANETAEILGSALFNAAPGVSLGYTAESDNMDVVSVPVAGGTVMLEAGDMAGEAAITVSAHASMPSGVKILDQTDPRDASVTFPVTVVLADLPVLSVAVAADLMEIMEGGMSTITATASRMIEASDGAVKIDLAVIGDATLSADSITIAAGSMTGSAMVTATEDDDDYMDETVTVVASGSGITGATQVAIAVTDNDEPPAPPAATVTAKSEAEVQAVFDSAVADARTGPDWVEGGAAAMVDMSMLFTVAEGAMPAYSGMSSDEMVVSASSSGMTLTLMPVSDGMATITVTAVDSASGDSATASGMVTVADLTFTIEMVSASAAMVEEGMSITITATGNKMVEGDNVEVMLMRDGASTASLDDYELDPPLITIMTGDDMGELTLMAEDDVYVEGMERLTLVAMMDGMNVGSPLMIEIADNDMESTFTLSVEDGEMNLVEGESYELTVMADPAVPMDTEVMIMRDRSMSDADDADFSAEPVMIMAGETMGTTMLMIEDDGPGDAGHGMPEMLVVFGMVDGMETNSLSFYTWDMAVPALPLIAQLLLAAFLAIGGYRRYLRR